MWVTMSPPDMEHTLSPTIVAHAPLDGGIEILSMLKLNLLISKAHAPLSRSPLAMKGVKIIFFIVSLLTYLHKNADRIYYIRNHLLAL